MINGDSLSHAHPPVPDATPDGQKRLQHQHQQLSPSPAQLAKTYKTCTNLFLTRRLPEALAGLHPIVSGHPSCMTHAPRQLRARIWGLYCAILDAAAKMGPDEGKNVWGSQEWRKLVAKMRSGSVWDEANRAYGGEGELDGDVVNALTTLLLAHAHDQSMTQRRIEAYLAAIPGVLVQDDDPKAVAQREKLMELYILHVLPRLGEWDYAREFTQMSPDLHDELKESYYATLDVLQKEKEEAEIYSHELERQRDEELEWERQQMQEDQKLQASPTASSKSSNPRRSLDAPLKAPSHRGDSSSEANRTRRKRAAPAKTAKKPSSATVASRETQKRTVNAAAANSSSSSLMSTATALLNRIQAQMLSQSGVLPLLRTFLMVATVAWMTSNRRLRERVRRLLVLCWIKVSRTIGMGMKVTYV